MVAFQHVYDKTVPLGQRLDVVFYEIRLGLFHDDDSIVKRNIERAKTFDLLSNIHEF